MASVKKTRVLVVEDDRNTAFTISQLLTRQFSVEVDTALDIASARELLSRENYDVVTLDYQLPDGDGLCLLDDIKRAGNHARAIVITGHGDEQVADRAFRAGALAYIVKDTRLADALSEAFRVTLDLTA